MSIPTIKRPSPATVIAILALLVAMGGTAEAVSTHILVRKGDIAKGAVTAKALAKTAVHPKAIAKAAIRPAALAKGAVGAAALSAGAVGAPALAPDAVTSTALSPGSVYGGALGEATIHSAPMVDLDAVAENGTWTASDTATVSCAAGEHLLSGGVVFTNPGNREVGVIESVPFTTGDGGWVGRITSNSGGSAVAEVQALCLK